MPADTVTELRSFQQFIAEQLRNGGPMPSPEECVGLWRMERERAETLAAIREGLEDVKAGRVQSLEEFDAEFRAAVVSKEQRFKALASEWKQATRFLSNVNTKVMHPAYQKIIGMGEAAVPFILDDLAKNGPNDWFWALHVLTEANPITDEISGNMAAMTEAWLQWGRKSGYLASCHQPTKNCFQA